MAMLNIGFGSMINGDRVMAALSPESAPVTRQCLSQIPISLYCVLFRPKEYLVWQMKVY